MKNCYESKSKILHHGRLLIRILKAHDVNIRGDKDLQQFTIYDAYNEKFMDHIHFTKLLDGLWIRKRGVQEGPDDKAEEAKILSMEGGDFWQSIRDEDIPQEMKREDLSFPFFFLFLKLNFLCS